MKTTKKAAHGVYITYYDKDGEHSTDPCEKLSVVSVDITFPCADNIKYTFSMWYGDEETGHSKLITVPSSHTINYI